VTTILAALIGAAIGSVGAQVVGESFRRRAAREEARRRAVDRYLLQLQDSIESLISRIDNLTTRRGRAVMGDTYYEVSTLYALGSFLAQKRRLLLDGIYPQLEELADGLGENLETLLESVEREVGRESGDTEGFQRYHRLALAEAVMERGEGGWSVGSYLSFAERYQSGDEGFKEMLRPAKQFAHRLPSEDCSSLLGRLNETGQLVARHTRIALSADS
jgi:hypothetical protein